MLGKVVHTVLAVYFVMLIVKENQCEGRRQLKVRQNNVNVDDMTKLSISLAKFSAKLIRELVQGVPHRSLVASPYTIFTTYGFLLSYTEDSTHKEIADILGTSKKTMRSMLTVQDGNTTINMGIGLFFHDDLSVSDSFSEAMYHAIGNWPINLNFANGAEASEKINKWISKETKGLIKTIAKPEMFNDSTSLVIVDTLFFMENWQVNLVRPPLLANFTSSKGLVKVKFMEDINTYEYEQNQELDAKILIKRYLTSNIACYYILPKSRKGLKDLLDNINKEDALIQMLERKFNTTKVDVRLPMATIENVLDIASLTKEFGMMKIHSDAAEFRGVLWNDEEGNDADDLVTISESLHGIKFTFDRNGTYPGTTDMYGNTLRPQETFVRFWAEHSFVFVVAADNLILFIGCFDG